MSDSPQSPKISVILPLYNKGAYVAKSITSVLGQSMPDFELIVVDDVSTDFSYDIARELGTSDPRIVIHRLPNNVGPYAARRAGVEIARAPLICFIDSDDWYESEVLDVLMRSIDESGADWAQMRYRRRVGLLHLNLVRNPDPGLSGRLIEGEEYRQLISFIGMDSDVSAACWNKIYRRSLLLEAMRHDCRHRWGEDQILNIHYGRMARNIIITDYCGYNYRWHSDTGSYRYTAITDYKAIARLKLLLGQDAERTYAELRAHWYYHVRQLLTELGWTPEAVATALEAELGDPIWHQAGIEVNAAESVRLQKADIRGNHFKYLVKRFLS